MRAPQGVEDDGCLSATDIVGLPALSMTTRTGLRGSGSGFAIMFIVLAMTCISINDMLIKLLSDGFPLHQIVFIRSAIGILFSLVILRF
ncbi:MAG: hypothetical protein AAGA73_20780, partial [Pseudomonadota bacterium]